MPTALPTGPQRRRRVVSRHWLRPTFRPPSPFPPLPSSSFPENRRSMAGILLWPGNGRQREEGTGLDVEREGPRLWEYMY